MHSKIEDNLIQWQGTNSSPPDIKNNTEQLFKADNFSFEIGIVMNNASKTCHLLQHSSPLLAGHVVVFSRRGLQTAHNAQN